MKGATMSSANHPAVPQDSPNSMAATALEAALYHLPVSGAFSPGVTTLMLQCRCGAKVDVNDFENHVLAEVGTTLIGAN